MPCVTHHNWQRMQHNTTTVLHGAHAPSMACLGRQCDSLADVTPTSGRRAGDATAAVVDGWADFSSVAHVPTSWRPIMEEGNASCTCASARTRSRKQNRTARRTDLFTRNTSCTAVHVMLKIAWPSTDEPTPRLHASPVSRVSLNLTERHDRTCSRCANAPAPRNGANAPVLPHATAHLRCSRLRISSVREERAAIDCRRGGQPILEGRA